MFTGHIALNELILNELNHLYQGIYYLEERGKTKSFTSKPLSMHMYNTKLFFILFQPPLLLFLEAK